MRTYAPVPFAAVSLEGGFWHERLETVLSRTVPSQYKQLVKHNMIEALAVKQPPPPLTIPRNHHNFTTQIFWDSDIGKWIEAASYALSHRRDDQIEAQIDEITELLANAQMEDGYLNCWYIGREPERRWTNLRDNHELYNAGHLLEGAIAYFQATGRRRLLDIMERYVDHIASVFGTGEDQKRGYPGHQEIELALIKLFHVTGDRKRLDLAAYFINERGRQSPHYFDEEARARGDDPKDFWAKTYEYNQSHAPVRDQNKVVGHAVRAMYMYAAMADLAADLDDDALRRACEVLWEDATGKRMYVTAGFGPSAQNEGFTDDYDLPNDTAYAETCASVAMIFWAQRMLNLDLDGKYADILERALFNGALSGLSQDGTRYFYENKLESDGSHRRWEWHPCPCCTMNASRLIASVAGYFYSTSTDGFAIHLYGGSKTRVELDGVAVDVEEKSDYPWSGEVAITVTPDKQAEFAVRVRIPDWAKGATAEVNGETVDIAGGTQRGYLEIRRAWSAGDTIALHLPMPAERVFAHPGIEADIGKIALRRGPLIYCLEQVDNPQTNMNLIRLPRSAKIEQAVANGLFEGIAALTATGRSVSVSRWEGALYSDSPPAEEDVMVTAIPYYLWANREAGPMRVWIEEC